MGLEALPISQIPGKHANVLLSRRQAVRLLTIPLFATACGLGGARSGKDNSPATLPQTAADVRITNFAANEYHATPSKNEQFLWAARFVPMQVPADPTDIQKETLVTEFQRRMRVCLDGMQTSAISELHDLRAQLTAYAANGEARTVIDKSNDGYFRTVPEILTIGEKPTLVVTIYSVLRQISQHQEPFFISTELAHEMEHVRSAIEFIHQQTDTKDPTILLARLHARTNDMQELIAEEARAYAVQARAYIKARGFGVAITTPFERNDLELLADNYIATGGTADSAGWKDYIYSNRVKNTLH